MPRYRLTIEYDGTPFCGWQKQEGQSSVQAALETDRTRLRSLDELIGRADVLRQRADVKLAKTGGLDLSFLDETDPSVVADRLQQVIQQGIDKGIPVGQSDHFAVGTQAIFGLLGGGVAVASGQNPAGEAVVAVADTSFPG